MIKIGDFARIAKVSVSTLRHYDEEGILCPCFVCPESNYRYYESDQLRHLHTIVVLKGLGFSLPEVKRLMNEAPDPTEMRRLLAVKRRESEMRLEKEVAQVHRIEHHIQIIEWRKAMPQLEVQRKTVPAMTIAAIRISIPTNNQAGDLLGKSYDQLCAGLAADHIAIIGPAMAHWHSTPEMLVEEVVDAAFQVEASAASDPAIRIIAIPETEVASVVHTGPFSEFQQCHVVLGEWLAKNKYRLDGPYREIYHTCPSDEATTEVQYPIAPE